MGSFAMRIPCVAVRRLCGRAAVPRRRKPRTLSPVEQQRCPFGMLSWITGEPAVPEQCGGAGLPEPLDAQRMQLVRLPGFLSGEEIELVLQTASGIQRDGAGSVRLQSSPASLAGPDLEGDDEGYETNRGEWSTTYLSTELMFQDRLPELHAKVVGAAIATDREHWGICTAALEAAADKSSELTTRVIELHTVGPTGGLPAPRHYDSGSCVTIDLMLSEPSAGGAFETLEIVDGEVRKPH